MLLNQPLLGSLIDWSDPTSKGILLDRPVNSRSGDESTDYSNNSFHGTLENGASYGVGSFGRTITVDGADDRISSTIPNDRDITSGTICVMFNMNAEPDTFDCIYSAHEGDSGRDGYALFLTDRIPPGGSAAGPPFRKLGLWVDNVLYATTQVLPFGNYVALATFDASATAIYVLNLNTGAFEMDTGSGATPTHTSTTKLLAEYSGGFRFQGEYFGVYISDQVFPENEARKFLSNNFKRYERPTSLAILATAVVPPSFVPFPRLSGMNGGISEHPQGGLSV